MRMGAGAVLPVMVLLTILAAAGCGGDDDGPVELRMSLILGENSDWYRGAKRFSDLVGERTDDGCVVTLYPHAQLAGQSQRTELEMLQSGVIDLSLESTILLSLIEPRMSVFSLPWLFDDYDEAHRVLDGPLGREMLSLLPRKGIVGLALGDNGFRQLTNSRNPVRTPGDLAGMKVRVPGIRMYISVFKHLGADPSSMNFGELFTALAQHTMDGQENPLSVIFSARLYEVQDYLSIWNYSFDPVILCMNRERWESLDEGLRRTLSECARDAMAWQRMQVMEGERALADSLRAKGMEVERISAGDMREFGRMTGQVYDEFGSSVGDPGLVARFREAVR